MTLAERRAKTELVDKAVATLMEHFEAVEILTTTRGENGETIDWARGAGNWYARLGIARAFVKRDEAQDIGIEVANQLPGDGGDGEDWKRD